MFFNCIYTVRVIWIWQRKSVIKFRPEVGWKTSPVTNHGYLNGKNRTLCILFFENRKKKPWILICLVKVSDVSVCFICLCFFFQNWTCIAGNYRPCDLNMPKTVPRRSDNHYDYAKDAPLTALGNFQAFLTGKMKQNLKKVVGCF